MGEGSDELSGRIASTPENGYNTAKTQIQVLTMAKPQTAEQVARRCLVLMAVVAAGHKKPRAKIRAWLRKEGLMKELTPQEKRLLASPTLSLRQRVWATWRVEALVPLLWSIGMRPRMAKPKSTVDPRKLLIPLYQPTSDFVQRATLRSKKDLDRANMEIYETHWAVRDAEINGKKIPGRVHPGIVQERHHALNWLLNFDGEAWDDVSTDT
jgi:hypothetical protein